MSISLVTGPANAGKVYVLLEAVRAHLARGEEPLLVVPTEADQARYRRELAETGHALGGRVERFEGLVAEIVMRARATRAPLGPLARECVFGRLADSRPGLARELARFVAELEAQRVTPARLRGALRAWGSSHQGAEASAPARGAQAGLAELTGVHGSSAAGEQADGKLQTDGGLIALHGLCDLFERYEQALVRMRRTDRELRVTRALDELRRTPSLWGSTPVLLYGFDDLTELQLDAVETLGVVVGARVTVSLAYEPGRVVFAGRAATFQRLAPLADSHTALTARAEHYAPHARHVLHHLERSLLTDDVTRVEPDEAVRLLEGGSPRAEMELVAGEVRALLDAGVLPEEVAIVHRTPDAIAGLLAEVLSDFEIPHALRLRASFAHTAVGRALLGLLRLAQDDGELGDLLAWLRAPGVLERTELADRFDAKARRQGAHDGSLALALWEAEHWPIERIDRLREAKRQGTDMLAEALISELRGLFHAPRRASAAVLGEDELDEARALVGAWGALEELRDLARHEPELAPTPAELTEVLERLEIPAGECPQSDRVAVVDPLSLRARRVRMVFACGLQEGVFPAPTKPHPLLGEQDRRKLAHASGLVLRGPPDALAAERYLFYALASRPEERLTLSWHTADEDGTSLARSLFVEDVCDLFTDTLPQRTARRFAGAAGWAGPGRPAGAMAVREAAIAHSRTGLRPRPIAALREERVLGKLRERELWSASSLETWAGCPVKWFVERLLHAREVSPDPEPIARGALAHAALKETLERLRERTGSARLTPASAGLAKRLLGETLEALEERYPLSVAPERVPGARRRLRVDLERYLMCAAEQQSSLEPTYLELEFGFEEEGAQPGGDERADEGPLDESETTHSSSSLPAFELGEGVLLRGRIDRVDVGPAGDAVVYDYKGRAAPPGARWAGDGAFQVALYMRAVQRLLGHRPVGGFYQPLAGRDIRPRGILDEDSGVELDCVRTDRRAGSDFDELLGQCAAMALQAAEQAKSGALQPRPDTCAYGGGCSYPTICRCER
jgi:ATP-dependent helicase/DNAse subunit B